MGSEPLLAIHFLVYVLPSRALNSLCLGEREWELSGHLALPTCHFELHHHHPGAPLQGQKLEQRKAGTKFRGGRVSLRNQRWDLWL